MINLLKSREDTSVFVTQNTSKMRLVGLFLLVTTVVTGLIAGSFYAYIYTQKQNLETRKQKAQKELLTQKNKESRYLLLKSRTAIVEKVLAASKQWEVPVDYALRLAQPPKLTSIISTDQGTMIWSYKLDSLEESLEVITRCFSLLSENKIKKPILTDFSIDKASSVKFSLEVTPVFE
jgi:hypothetical protein